jgi:hypothetical protein
MNNLGGPDLRNFRGQADRIHQDIAKTRREVRRHVRFFRTVFLAWVVFWMGLLGSLAWCAYHVLKAKGLVP